MPGRVCGSQARHFCVAARAADWANTQWEFPGTAGGILTCIGGTHARVNAKILDFPKQWCRSASQGNRSDLLPGQTAESRAIGCRHLHTLLAREGEQVNHKGNVIAFIAKLARTAGSRQSEGAGLGTQRGGLITTLVFTAAVIGLTDGVKEAGSHSRLSNSRALEDIQAAEAIHSGWGLHRTVFRHGANSRSKSTHNCLYHVRRFSPADLRITISL